MAVYAIAHNDADGIVSARLLEKMEGAKAIFQTWDRFGISPRDEVISQLLNERGNTIFIIDLGCSKETLETCQRLAGSNKVVLIDHHLPDEGGDPFTYASPSLSIIHSLENCTSGLVYNYGRAMGKSMDYWCSFWATVGIIADVAEETVGGKEILETIRKSIPQLFWKRVFWSGRSEFTVSFASSVGSMINAARRLAYHYGAPVALEALKEIERAGILMAINPIPHEVDFREEAQYPHLALLRRWHNTWLEKKDEIFERENIVNIDFDSFGISIVNHPWDIAGYVANVKSGNKPWFAINYGVPGPRANMSARSRDQRVNLNDAMKRLAEITEGRITGGGHAAAVGGLIDRSMSIFEVVNAIERAMGGGI